jgi:hypothetical protein
MVALSAGDLTLWRALPEHDRGGHLDDLGGVAGECHFHRAPAGVLQGHPDRRDHARNVLTDVDERSTIARNTFATGSRGNRERQAGRIDALPVTEEDRSWPGEEGFGAASFCYRSRCW